MNVQISGWKWFPLLKGVSPAARAERSEARRGERRPEGATQPVIDA